MAKGDVAATFTLPKEVDDLITTMAQRRKTTRRAVILRIPPLCHYRHVWRRDGEAPARGRGEDGEPAELPGVRLC
jgi:hypothetical protein